MPPRSKLPLVLALLLAGCGSASSELRIIQVPGVGASPSPAAPRPLAFGSVTDTLTSCGGRLADGRFAHRYHLHLAAGQNVRLIMHSSAVDSVLEVTGPGDWHRTNDDGFPGNLDSVLMFAAPVAADYEIVATTVHSGQGGPYTLLAESVGPGLGTALPLETATQGALIPAAPGALPGAWFHFEAQGGASVRLRVTSSTFDTVATVFGPDGQTWFNDDANDVGPDRTERPLDSTVVLAVPATGRYTLVVTSYRNQGGGIFRIATSVRSPVVVAPGEEVPANGGWAGADAHGRLLGVFVGITAYPGGALYGCADDATFLAQALRSRHLMAAADQVVLTDAAANRAAFHAAIARIAERARPEDVVVVFYSGHGNVQPAAAGDATELDGTDETIQLIDGPLTDNEVVHDLEAVHASLTILALDSCHSGGFAEDFVTRAGRLGLFSSDADVLSDTAEPRQAGGYLSWYLRRGVLGDADGRPHDGVLLAGELSDYVYEGFVRDHRLFNREGDASPLQRLVVARGSVAYGQQLWTYPRGPDLVLVPTPDLPLTSAPPSGGAPPTIAPPACTATTTTITQQ